MWQKILLRVILRFGHSNLITTGIGPVETFITESLRAVFQFLQDPFNHLKPLSDCHLISPYSITAGSFCTVMRTKGMIAKPRKL